MSEEQPIEAVLLELAEQVEQFAQVLSASDELLWREPVVGEWSAAMVVVHMSDAEVHVAARLRRLLTEENEVYPNWSEADHAALSSERSPEIALAVIAGLRASNSDLVRRLSAAALARTATLPNGEIVDAVGLLERHVRHTAAHLHQARSALTAQ